MIISIQKQTKIYKNLEDITSLINKIEEPQQITELNISGNTFYPEALSPLFTLQFTQLTKLDISNIFAALPKHLMHEGLNIICNSIDSSKLTHLNISENAISCDFTENFKNFLKNLKNCKSLKMSNCGFGEKGGILLSEILMRIAIKTNLVSIDLSRNKLTESGGTLGIVFAKFINLKNIKMQYNNISSVHMEVFIKSLEEHVIHELDLRDNVISKEGCELLGRFFVDWKLKVLKISDCLIRNDGIECFIREATKKRVFYYTPGSIYNNHKICFDISYNDLDQSAVDQLALFMKRNYLKELNIAGNEFDNIFVLKEIAKEKKIKLIVEEEEESDENVEINELSKKIETML